MTLAFVVEGEPVPKGRARTRVVRTKGGATFAQHYTPAATRAFEERVAIVCRVAASRVRWTPGPKDRFSVSVRVYRTHEGAGGDLDNYVKAVSDAINGVAFSDDRYVRELRAFMGQDRQRPRIEVSVEVL